ncbi:type III secretion system export apparatus subunit SctT [Pseudomonas sp. CFBP 13719]|uniref:type III secretion system export apparatus subunit SctT n=1 Tax=Pseudomonas sp. CFBP 13719 TaxID=2775303 RepID=UPI00177BE40D|nr:type III secretion system export apparatus subunit SctT [Pseudomonas sp. CFBP 13719]MBD8680233.1 type III secretion system export apparatus subunit SctT [Pseudomonas sp. CFBP 13719]
MLGEQLAGFFDLAYPLLSAFGMAVARALGMIIITPAFNRLGLTGMIRSAVAVVVSIPIAPDIFIALAGEQAPSTLMLMALLIKEMIIGVVIGLIFGIPFWAAEVAGELIDLQRGSTMAQLLDPLSSGESSVTSTLLSITLITLFFMSGGFTLMLDGLYRSYQLWPALAAAPALGEHSVMEIVGVLDKVMQTGVLMIAPVVIAILTADLLLAYLARMAPQLHVFDLSLSVKNLLFSFLMVVYVSFMIPYMLSQLGAMRGWFDVVESTVQAGLQTGAP